ncbi:hypothetical protein [Actinokineospora sp. NBRC 105648]|uniref:hypothetical protein n=1 Tax=Actinokineospora sp. NBRC 105648 TaxID=3032206 RepID=UPI0024A30066|nr:hypothetical protein [Actinokineospora sp. NBRC 105648]GLZ40777.1 hypothetical protein Acsp05_44010 [Actinokineospora sp. NBRC 105648]
MTKHTRRAATVFGALALLALGAGQASAAETPAGAPSAQDLASIRTAVDSPDTHDWLATTVFPDTAGVSAGVAAQTATADAGSPIAVYQPTAAFIRGTSATPAELAYVAVPAKTGNGSVATVATQRVGGKWQVFDVASGDYERAYAAKAGKGYLLREPQVNAWYSVEGGKVTVLEGSVTGVANGTTMTVADLRAALNARYGDKLPGSAYDRSGAAGGYGPTVAASAPAESDSTLLTLGLIGGAVVLIGGATTAVRLRRD